MKRYVLAMLAALTLAACGGGAGSNTNQPFSANSLLAPAHQAVDAQTGSATGTSTTTTDQLYQFFAVAFNAAPGVTYMGQLNEAAGVGMTIKQIVNVFTTKTQFTDTYPTTLSNYDFAVKLINNVVGTSATDAAKTSAVNDVVAALALPGWTRGDVIFAIFSNLAAKPANDADWAGTSLQMKNQVVYAKYYTETLKGDTTDLATLRKVLTGVTSTSSTATGDLTTKLYSAACSVGQIAICSGALAAKAASIKRLRAVHAMGNWGGNVQGFASPLLNEAPSITAQRVTVITNRGSFVDAQGVTQTNDLAEITLEGVQLGNGRSLTRAGFWVYRDMRTGSSGLQFRPQLNSNLAGIDGFSGDVNVSVPAVGATTAPDVSAVRNLTGTARALVLAVLAQGGNLARSGSYTVSGSAQFGDMATLSAALDRLTTLLDTDKAYFDYLASMNVEWIGVTVGMHHDNISTTDIVTRQCAAGVNSFLDSNNTPTVCTFADADLQSFISRARARGFRIYLTLAFETSSAEPATSPACGTASYKVARFWLGIPQLPAGTTASKCVSVANWWWNPAHPDYTTKVAKFWASYQQVATKYAAMAQALGVEIFSLGTETEQLFRTRSGTGAYTHHFLPQLQAMVQAVRQVYSGLLTYDQHSNQLFNPEWFGGEQSVHYVFADLQLDVVGISAYFSLVPTPPNRVLSVTELEAAWETVFTKGLQPLQARNPGKPILFTEFGVVDHVNAPFDQQSGAEQPEPPFDAAHPTEGMVQQSNLYQALFNVNTRYADLVTGIFFWGHDYLPYNNYTCRLIDWGTSCRPARNVISTEYARWKSLP